MSSHEPSAPTAAAPSPLQTGDLLDGRYRIGPRLGGGGMASVFFATHVGLSRPVAIKIVSPLVRDLPGVGPRFLREAHAATRLKSEHVVRVFDVGTAPDGAPYMVMELLEGHDLAELLERSGAPSPEEAVGFILQACEALAEVHGLGIVHRDLKPANLFVTRGPDGLPCVKLIDFGISRFDVPLGPPGASDDALAAQAEPAAWASPEMVMGSPRYMAPEQMESASAADARSDIWGLGAILYELLVGDPAFEGESLLDIYAAVVSSPPPRPSALRPALPKGLDEVVLGCLRVDPSDRYPDVAALARALAPFGGEGAATRADAVARVLEATRRSALGPAALDTASELAPAPSEGSPAGRASWWAPRGRSAVLLGAAAAGLFVLGLAAPSIVRTFDAMGATDAAAPGEPTGAEVRDPAPSASDTVPSHAISPPTRARAATRITPPWAREVAPASLAPHPPASSWRASPPLSRGDDRSHFEERE